MVRKREEDVFVLAFENVSEMCDTHICSTGLLIILSRYSKKLMCQHRNGVFSTENDGAGKVMRERETGGSRKRGEGSRGNDRFNQET